MDISEDLKNLIFTFQWDNKPVDMLNNEYVSMYVIHRVNKGFGSQNKVITEFDLENVSESDKNYFSKIYKKNTIMSIFGSVY